MKTINFLAGVACVCLGLFSCNNTELSPSPDENTTIAYHDIVKLSNVDAQKAFSKILSKAVSESREVRNFIKTEALAQFDNDYDVFYPFVKDKVVTDGKTFRDILLSYCDSDDELIRIEESSLLLNILVPDLTLFWDFNAEQWNTDDSEIAVISRDDIDNTLYENGEAIGSMPSDEIPGFPCLVVKENERMVIANSATRASNTVYEFAHDAYNPAKTVSTRKYEEWDMVLETADPEIPYAKAADLDPSVITGWNEFKLDATKAQRDYPYYGMTKTNSKGKIKINYAEEVFLFRVSATKFGYISDQFTSPDNDPQLNESVSPGKGSGPRDVAWILSQIWKDGNFEIDFKTYLGSAGTTQGVLSADFRYSVPVRKMFSIDKARVEHETGNLFTKKHYVYRVNVNDLKSRWIRPTQLPGLHGAKPVFTRPWNLSNSSLDVYLFISEHDASGSMTTQKIVNSSYSTTVTTGTSTNEDKNEYSATNSTEISNTVTFQRTLGADELGVIRFDYRDPVIMSDSEKTTKGYKLYSENNGYIEVVLAPRKRY